MPGGSIFATSAELNYWLTNLVRSERMDVRNIYKDAGGVVLVVSDETQVTSI